MNQSIPAIFDGHNDTLTRLNNAGGVAAAERFLTGLPGHIDLPRAAAAGFAGGFFAIWVATPEAPPLGSNDGAKVLSFDEMMQQAAYDVPLAAPIEANDALRVVMDQIAILLRLQSLGALTICTSVAQLKSCLDEGKMAAIMHIEGAEAIDESLQTLDVLYPLGLRSLGPVWSRQTIFAEGVPFRFPSDPNIGAGLTRHGRALVHRCNQLGIMLDLSHLNEAGFWDIAKISSAPLVATHSNAHVLCQHARNLTDKQLHAIAESGGMVGLNFATAFLRADGKMRKDVPLTQMIRHLDHLMNILGEDGVGFGSDFDGATVPEDIQDVSGLQAFRHALRNHGYNDVLMTKLCHANWLRVLENTWGK